MNYYAIERSTDHLAHYGVKGMRWGVRRAIATENQRALDRHYRKAAKKLAKLQNISNPYKSAAKAAAYGAAAAGTGALAIGGTDLLSKGIRGARTGVRAGIRLATGKTARPLSSMTRAADAVEKWGQGYSTGNKLADSYKNVLNAAEKSTRGSAHTRIKMRTIKNSDYARLAAAAATAALAAKAAQNARRVKNSEKNLEKAQRWKDEMDDVFSGTDYEGSYAKMSRRQQKRRRSYY